MKLSRHTNLWLGVCCGLASLLFSQATHAQSVGQEQLRALAPNTNDLQGTTSIRPAGDLPPVAERTSPATVIEDSTVVDADAAQWHLGWAPLPDHPGRFSQISRYLYTTDGDYQLAMTISVCDSPGTAKDEVAAFLHDCSASFQPGTFSSAAAVGDESWFNPYRDGTLLLRAGNLVVSVTGLTSHIALKVGNVPPFPTSAIEAVAYQILLRASQQPALTDVIAEQARMDVNGRALPKNALRVAGQTYVPVQEFAKAMGLTSGWDSRTGALTLSGAGRKTVALTAGSTAATVGGQKAAALAVPVLKQAGQPVMTLDDLLAVTGGRVESRSGGTVRVKA